MAASPQELEQLATGRSIVAPIGGLNARDALANMAETDAVILDNLFPRPSWVEVRGGKRTIAKASGCNFETVAAYNGSSGVRQLYGAGNASGTRSIFRVDGLGGGNVGAPVVGGAGGTVQAITNTQYDWWAFGTGSGQFLYLVNGADNALLYDGTTWRAITGVSAPYALTGVATSSLSCVVSYKQRLWFLQQGTFNVWYLAQNAIAGALTQLNLAPLFQLGGYLVSIVSVSIDNSAGLSDYIAFVSSEGEVVVFQGYDPSTTATWDESARFRIGHPIGLGRRCWQKMGSDAALITVDGVVMLSDALLTDRSQTKNELSDKIRNAIIGNAQVYGALFGWQIMLHPIGSKLIVNVPTTIDAASFNYVMNTLTGAWCTFGQFASPWNAFCWEVQGDSLYYGTAGAVCQADTQPGDDDGQPIVCTGLAAFSYFGEPGVKKSFGLARPIIALNGTLNLAIGLAVDFNTQTPVGAVGITLGNSSPWNTSLWSTPTYWGDPLITFKQWFGAGGLGYAGALSVRISSLDAIMQWSSTDFTYEPAEQAGP